MEARLNLAVVTETYPPEANGIALSLERTVRHLRGRGHRVEVIRPRQSRDQGADQGTDVLMRGLAVPRMPGLQFGLPAGAALMRRWREAPPDHVHIATEGPLAWSALFAARRLGIPATTVYGGLFRDAPGFSTVGAVGRVVLRAFHNRSDLTLVSTRALAGELARDGYRHVACVGSGVDSELFSPARRSPELRARWGLDEGQLAVLHVGQLSPDNDHLLVRRAFRAIRRDCPCARLIWVGDGPMRFELGREASGEIFAGEQAGVALAEHYASADIFLAPSLCETGGETTLEAMASGLPIVAFDVGAAREYLADRVNARLLTPPWVRTPAARAFAATAFIDAAAVLALQAGERRVLGGGARHAAVPLVWSAMLARLESHLLACAARRRAMGPLPTTA